MLHESDRNLKMAVENLIFDCAQCQVGDTLLIIHENENDGYYDPQLGHLVEQAAQSIGLKTQMLAVPFERVVSGFDEALEARMAVVDCSLFFARLGDQLRFNPKSGQSKQIISYALDREMLSSPFGTVPYSTFVALRDLINKALSSAENIHVTCPEGTDFHGRVSVQLTGSGDVTQKRFPLSVFTPVPAETFEGRIAQRGFLTGTGSNYYEPYSCELKDTLFVNFDGNRITGFDGNPRDVKAAEDYYEFVGNKFGIDTYFVHSWHAGIHPACHYPQAAAQSFERWSGGAFGNPRLLHFHTCGAYPPGEISLNLLDPTILIDGVALWKDGRLQPDLIPEGQALLDANPDMRALFEIPRQAVGQGSDGKLSFA